MAIDKMSKIDRMSSPKKIKNSPKTFCTSVQMSIKLNYIIYIMTNKQAVILTAISTGGCTPFLRRTICNIQSAPLCASFTPPPGTNGLASLLMSPNLL